MKNANYLSFSLLCFHRKVWPKELRDDVHESRFCTDEPVSGVALDRQRVYKMLKPTPYPDEFPKLNKIAAMEQAAKNIVLPDLEDLGEVFQK